jgi:actin-related protein
LPPKFRPQYNYKSFADVFDDETQLYLEVEEFLTHVFYNVLHANMKEKQVVVVESIFGSRTLTRTIGNVIFRSFGCKFVFFVLGNLMPLYVSGLDSGLVIDMGF